MFDIVKQLLDFVNYRAARPVLEQACREVTLQRAPNMIETDHRRSGSWFTSIQWPSLPTPIAKSPAEYRQRADVALSNEERDDLMRMAQEHLLLAYPDPLLMPPSR